MTKSNVLIYGIGLVLLIWLQSQIWLGKASVISIYRLNQQAKALSQQNDAQQKTNNRLLVEVNGLKHGNQAIEAIARESLGMIEQGETYYQLRYQPLANKNTPSS